MNIILSNGKDGLKSMIHGFPKKIFFVPDLLRTTIRETLPRTGKAELQVFAISST